MSIRRNIYKVAAQNIADDIGAHRRKRLATRWLRCKERDYANVMNIYVIRFGKDSSDVGIGDGRAAWGICGKLQRGVRRAGLDFPTRLPNPRSMLTRHI